MVSRRRFLRALIASCGLYGSNAGREILAGDSSRGPAASDYLPRSQPRRSKGATIDRAALVSRHNPTLRALDPLSPLSLGNGEFAFTADVTGLQTFPREYGGAVPLCTMSQWGWHTSPLPRGLDPASLRLTYYDTHGRAVGYHTSAEGQKELYDWLRENPHRLHLGRIGLRLLTDGGGEARASDLRDVEQTLDLWRGVLTSRFSFRGERLTVRTAVHPTLDLLAAAIESGLTGEGRPAVRFAFPYGSPDTDPAGRGQPARHRTT